MIDTDGNAARISPTNSFLAYQAGGQTATLRRIEGAQAAGTGERGRLSPRSAGFDGSGGTDNAGRRLHFLWAGQRSLFLRRTGHPEQFQFTGEDFFADKDICSIVLEVPNSALGRKRLAYGPARSFRQTARAGLGQTDPARGPTKTPSLPASKMMPTSPGNRGDARFVPVSRTAGA